MNQTSIRSLKKKDAGEASRVERRAGSLPAWWVVFTREMSELWVWGKALTLIILYSVYLGISSYVFAANSELSLIPPKEMIYLTLSGAITVGIFVALIIGADSFSGERERSTLEALLLTPATRTQIVVGKFLASASPWPLAALIAVPYVLVLSQGNDIVPHALLWGAILGTILVPAFTGFGMLVSMWSGSNRTSLFASLTLYLLFLLPVQFPGTAQAGTFGKLLKKLDPLEGADHFLENTIVNNRTPHELMPYLWASIVFAALVFLLLFLFAAPRLELDGGFPIKLRRRKVKGGAVMGLLIAALLLVGAVIPVRASPMAQAKAGDLQISVDMTSASTKNGDKVQFHTTLTNTGTRASPPIIVAMNIINIKSTGDVVDPEDWSPQRTQYLQAVGAGESATQSWTLNTILSGDYMVYVVALPVPEDSAEVSQPLTSPGIRVSVASFARLNPGGILPYAIGIPLLLLLALAALMRMRQRTTDTSDRA